MKVLVRRGAANKMADETIVDILANAYSTAVSKGQNFLYEEGFDKMLYDIVIPFRDDTLICSDLVEIEDASLGEDFRARATSWKISADTQTENAVIIDHSIEIERSLDNE